MEQKGLYYDLYMSQLNQLEALAAKG